MKKDKSKSDDRIVQRGEREEPRAAEVHEEAVEIDRDPLSITPEEVENILREEAMSNALPSPPQLPGWHTCWLSTTNQYVPVQYYVRLGYVPVTTAECSGWAYLKQHSAQIGEHITCNEMLLYKVPMAIYQKIMRVTHHDRPNQEAERLLANVEQMKEGAEFRDSSGNSLVREEGDGLASIVDRKVRVGDFE